MEDEKLIRLHDALRKLRPGGKKGGLGYGHAQIHSVNGKRTDGLPDNGLYAMFVREGHADTQHKKFQDEPEVKKSKMKKDKKMKAKKKNKKEKKRKRDSDMHDVDDESDTTKPSKRSKKVKASKSELAKESTKIPHLEDKASTKKERKRDRKQQKVDRKRRSPKIAPTDMKEIETIDKQKRKKKERQK